jgi:hypothetical protein
VVHAALQPECPAAQFGRRRVRDQRVARRRAQALPQPVHHAEPDHLPRRPGDRDDGPDDDGDEIPEHDQRAAQRDAVREPASPELHDSSREVGRPVERA